MTRTVPGRTALLVVLLALTLATAGWGGGGGGGGEVPPDPDESVVFGGFLFRSGSGAETGTPPMEDPGAVPPLLGAPLNVTPDSNTPSSAPVVAVQGTYHVVDTTVEFFPVVSEDIVVSYDRTVLPTLDNLRIRASY